MPQRVSRQMDCAQAVPDVQKVAVVEKALRDEWLERQNASAKRLEEARDLCPTVIAGFSGIVIGIKTRGGDPCARLSRDSFGIQYVVEVTVRQDDAANRFPVPSTFTKRMGQELASADKTDIKQNQTGCVLEDVKVQGRSANLKQTVLQFVVHEVLHRAGKMGFRI